MIFTSGGMMYRLLVNDIPVGTNTTKGVSISSLIEFNPGETVQTIYSIYRETDAKYVLFITKNGTAKKTTLEEYLKTKKKTGIQALNFREGDSLAEVTLIKDEEMFIVTRKGFVVRMKSTDISASGRLTVGVKGINLTEGDEVVAVLPIRDATDDLAVFSEYGIGKRIPIKEFTLQGRGTRGLMCYKMTEATGNIAAATLVSDDDMVLVAGVPNSICIKGSDIAIGSRSALGVQIIKGSKILSVSKV
jgi:DNA gyrase subunit A